KSPVFGMPPAAIRLRRGSPRSGCSTLITAAPQSASTAAHDGTIAHSASSMTFTPSSSDSIGSLLGMVANGARSPPARSMLSRVDELKDQLRPTIDEVTRFFWDGAARGELLIQRCGDCMTYTHWPLLSCPACGSARLEPARVSGRGEVFSFT